MKFKELIVLICMLTATRLSAGYKILAIFPMPVHSHYILVNVLLSGLAEAGHNITMISPFTQTNPPKNGSWRDIVLMEERERQGVISSNVAHFDTDEKRSLFFLFNVAHMTMLSTENTLNHTNVQKLMASGEKFDAVIAGQFMNDGVKALAKLFDAHLIIFSSVGSNGMISDLVGIPTLPSLVPDVVSNFPARMSFTQRFLNTIMRLIFSGILHFQSYPTQNSVVKKYFPPSVDLYDVLYNVSLVLLNSHISISHTQPLVPCMIDIGGFHIKPPKKLPADLQSYLDDAKEGVIYMSMGSIMKSTNMPVEKRNAILQAFGKLKQKVLWKWEADDLPGKPPNVKVGKWLPQQDILAHPNVKLFITHGGLLSTTETVYHGVPIIAIPIFGDQKMNSYSAERAGYGIVLPFAELSEEKLSSLLEEILINPRYADEAQRRSRIMKDRLFNPLDEAIYWVEYVIRHNGAKHLRVAYLDMPWYQYYLLDVFVFILAVIVGTYVLLRGILRCLIRKVKQSKTKVD